MTRTELENIIGGTISEEIAKEYIKATNRLVNSIIEYIDELYSTGYNNEKHKAISIAYENAIKLIDNAWDKKIIKIDEHMRLCKYTTSIFQKFIMTQLDNEIMNADEFKQMLTYEDTTEDFKDIMIEEVKITNFERIKKASVEELAEIISEVSIIISEVAININTLPKKGILKSSFIEWLQSNIE